MYISYTENELEHLRSKDKILATAIDKMGYIKREKDEDLFSSVLHHIIGQQISMAAQKTIWTRLKEKIGIISPEKILSLSENDLQSIGISFRKSQYIIDFALKVNEKTFDIEGVSKLNDDDLKKELIKLKGVGAWTAEMIMIFCLDRKDVLSYDDLGIRRGLQKLYHHKKIDKKLFEKYRKRYSPYATIASLYLWEISSGRLDSDI